MQPTCRIISTHESQAGSDKKSAQTNRIWAVCMEVCSGRLFFFLLNPSDPPQNPFSTTQGSVSGLRQALTGGTVRSTDKVTVWHKGPVWVMLKKYINTSHTYIHTYTHTRTLNPKCYCLFLFFLPYVYFTSTMMLHVVHRGHVCIHIN